MQKKRALNLKKFELEKQAAPRKLKELKGLRRQQRTQELNTFQINTSQLI